MNFNFFEGDDYLTKHLIINHKSGKQELCDLEFNFIELPKFNDEELKIESLIEKWVYFIKKAPNLQVIPADIQDEGLLHAYEDAAEFNWTKKELLAYDYASMRKGDVRGVLELAVKRGIEKALEQVKIEAEKDKDDSLIKTILNFHNNGVDLNTIALSLGITIEEVKSCLNSVV